MKISLIGMSGSGKTHWSKKLEKKGYKRFCIDDLLEKKLETGLKQLGYRGIADLAKWMRQPYEDRHATTSATYLAYEEKTLKEVLDLMKNDKFSGENVVIDTTGSVVYLDKTLRNALSKLTTVVYFETPQSVQKEMYELYMRDPKPVFWGESFSKKNGESNFEALQRCYPELLAYRTKEYEKFAQVTLPYHLLREKDFTLEKFMNNVLSPSSR